MRAPVGTQPAEPLPTKDPGARRFFLAVYGVLAVAIWAVFNPGIINDDGIPLLWHADTGHYDNVVPVIMLLVTRLLYILCGGPSTFCLVEGYYSFPDGQVQLYKVPIFTGGSPALILFLQILAGLYGLRFFCREGWRRLSGRSEFGVRQESALLAFVGILLAFTPVVFYLVSYIKDAWLLIALFWLGGCLLRQPRRPSDWVVLVGLMAFACLSRHNAVVLLPLFMLLLGFMASPRRRMLAALALPALLAGFLGFAQAILRPVDFHPQNQVLVLDLVGMAMDKPEVLEEMPFIRSTMTTEDIARFYQHGAMGRLYDVMNFNMAQWGDPARLRSEYLRVAARHPVLWLRVKFKAFLALLFPGPDVQPFYRNITCSGNEYPLNPRFAPLRARIETWFSVWLRRGPGRILNSSALWLMAGLIAWPFILKVRNDAQLFLVAAIPLLYAATFLLATVSRDPRFLHPAAIPIQIALLLAVPTALRGRVRGLQSGSSR